MSENILEVKNLNITLGENEIIKDLALHVDAGDFLTIQNKNSLTVIRERIDISPSEYITLLLKDKISLEF